MKNICEKLDLTLDRNKYTYVQTDNFTEICMETCVSKVTHSWSIKLVFFFFCFLLQYIRKLLFSDLDKSTVENVLRQLRKLPWAECEQYLVKCFLKVHRGKYSQVHLIALLTAGLGRYHDDFAVAIVDEVSFLTEGLDTVQVNFFWTKYPFENEISLRKW